ncbi:MAG: hypothetical protein IE937_01160 [Gammaproteobacteria bacterium]|nr:hypothetical protein [Gammaproteobacteria bacterium]
MNNMTTKDVMDVAAASTAVASTFNWMPKLAAFLAVVWTLIRIYEWARFRIFGITDDKGQFK